MRYAAALACLLACGEPDDPCADRPGTCVTVHVKSANVERIDQLELDVLYGEIHGTTTTQPAGGGAATLPLVTAIELEPPGTDPFAIGVVAAGKLSGVVLGTGAAQATIAPGEHASIDIMLAAPGDCTPGTFYCGGDKLAGDPRTLYQCNGGGVPHARGVCIAGCTVLPAKQDTCHGEGTCIEGTDYCGGDKLDGDPQTLYRCTAGIGTNPRPCANGCRVRAGDDDICR